MADDLGISVVQLRKAYGSNVAVDGVSFDVGHGEVFALLGPNGAGKTTTVEILEGVRRRDSGSVRVLGADPAVAGAAWKQRVGVVLQGTGEFDDLTVFEVVRHFARFYARSVDPVDAIERVGLAAQASSRTHNLSGGQKRRLDVALGIINSPDLLFLDEPTTGFDPAARREFWDFIKQLSSDGTTILLTTHYLEEAEVLADRVGVIAGGRMIAISTPTELGARNRGEATVTWRDGSVTTTNPTAVIDEMSARYGGDIPELVVTRPSLEDIYLRLIGQQ
jgi:ABC-2 type transport system ATP-binding protein